MTSTVTTPPLQLAPANQQIPQTPHTEVIYWYGLFMVTWSILETVLQAAIMKQLRIGADEAVIVTGKMQFNPRVQLLCALLKRQGDTYQDAIKLLNKTEGFAHRNTMVHGSIVVGVPGQLTFVKYDGGSSAKRMLTAEDMKKHVLALNARIMTLQGLLQTTDADLQLIGDSTLRMAS
jgi:hypothetical protein